MTISTKLSRHRHRPGYFKLPTLSSLLLLLPLLQAHAQPFVYERSIGQGQNAIFTQAADVAVDSHGHLVVLDAGRSLYQICDDQGNCDEHGSFGDQPGQFFGPLALDVNSDDAIFITDSGNQRVQQCDHAGNCEGFEISGIEEGFNIFNPWGIAVDRQDRVIIADSSNSRIIVCPKSGGDCDEFGTPGQEVGQFTSPGSIAVDDQNRIFIVDGGFGRVQICTRSGNCEVFGLTGEGQWHFQGPTFIETFSNGVFGIVENGVIASLCTERAVCRSFAQTNFINPDPSYPQGPMGMAEDADGNIILADFNSVRFYRPNVTINPAMSVGTFNTATAGQGVLWDVFQELGIVFGAWFTYELQRPAQDDATLGESAHRWLTMQLAINGNTATGDVFRTRGGVFDSADPAVEPSEKVGTATLEWHDCSTAWLSYDLTDPPLSGMIELRRLTEDAVPLCVVLSGDP